MYCGGQIYLSDLSGIKEESQKLETFLEFITKPGAIYGLFSDITCEQVICAGYSYKTFKMIQTCSIRTLLSESMINIIAVSAQNIFGSHKC